MMSTKKHRLIMAAGSKISTARCRGRTAADPTSVLHNAASDIARTVMSVQIEAGFKVMLDVIAAAETRQAAAVTYPRQVIEVRISDADRSRRRGLPLSPAIRAGEFVFLSGLPATDPVTAAPARGTVAAETRLILTNMGQLLEAA